MMCTTCGCTAQGEAMVIGHPHDHDHGPGHEHGHDHDHGHAQAHSPRKVISIEEDILARNQLLAERNRGWFGGRGILAVNLMSSPGAGKTTLLERTLLDLKAEMSIGVVEGDQATENDSKRIRATGCPAVQINTGAGCHLDAHMLEHGLEHLRPAPGSLVFIENVGNLVCPALFDLGERAKVVVLSVTEGDDKPEKYPHMFQAAELMVLNKTDLLPYVRFDVDRAFACAREVNPAIRMICLSAITGEGTGDWYDWIRGQRARLASESIR